MFKVKDLTYIVLVDVGVIVLRPGDVEAHVVGVSSSGGDLPVGTQMVDARGMRGGAGLTAPHNCSH